MATLSEDPSSDPQTNVIPYSDVVKNKWWIVGTSIYDFEEFAPEHPGGAAVVTELAGTNATKEFLHAHPTDIMKLTLGREGLAKAYRGEVDPATLPLAMETKEKDTITKDSTTFTSLKDLGPDEAPPLEAVLNLHDFEAIAQRVMVNTGKKEAWDYYSSGADDELTYNENVSAFQRIWLKPRILVNVKNVDITCTILGSESSIPVYLSAVAMCGMGHVDGECAWARAAGNEKTIFMVPNLNSKGFSNIVTSRTHKEQPLWFQIYVNPDRTVVLDQIRDCEAAGITSLCITVDSAVAGKRERDLRNKLARQIDNQRKKDADNAVKEAARIAAGGGPAAPTINKGGSSKRKAGSYANRDPALNWDDVSWFQKNTSMKIVIKGVS
jgi:L-lactate dehydrogenase (cytochrome)